MLQIDLSDKFLAIKDHATGRLCAESKNGQMHIANKNCFGSFFFCNTVINFASKDE